MNCLDKVKLAKAAYIQDPYLMEEVVSSIAPKPNAVATFYVEKTDTEGFACKYEDVHGDSLILGFSGTESHVDLKYDLLFYPTNYYEGMIHCGFSNCVEQFSGPMNEAIYKLFGSKDIWNLTTLGHSLGGSMAIGCLPRIEKKWAMQSTVTYGCPNGWSRSAIKYMNKRYFIKNYINWFDYVTWFLGFFTGRPGINIKIYSIPGHMIWKYQRWMEKRNDRGEGLTCVERDDKCSVACKST